MWEGLPAVHNQNQWTVSKQKSPSAIFFPELVTNWCTSCRVLLPAGGCKKKKCTVLLLLFFFFLLTISLEHEQIHDDDETPC